MSERRSPPERRSSIELRRPRHRPHRPRRRPAAHRSAAAEPRHAPPASGEGRPGGAARRRRRPDLAPPLRPPRPPLAAAARPRDAGRRAEGRGRADPPQGGREERRRARARESRSRSARSPSARRTRATTRGGCRSGSRPTRSATSIEGGGHVGLLRRRHRRLRRDGRARTCRRRAAPDLGLGADDGARPHGSGPGGGGGGARCGARVAIPIHWGTYYPIHLGVRGSPGVSRHAARRCSREALREHSPRTELRVLRPGESAAV